MPSLHRANDHLDGFEDSLPSAGRDVHVLLLSDGSSFTENLTTALGRESGITVSVEQDACVAIERVRHMTRGMRPDGSREHDAESATPAQETIADDEGRLDGERIDCILCDCDTTDLDLLELLDVAHESDPALPVVLLVSDVSDNAIADAFRRGAADILRKDAVQPYSVLANRIRAAGSRYQTTITMQVFYQAVEHAGHSIYITDSEGEIEYVNPAFEETTGYTAEEAIGQTPAILQSGVHDDEFYETLWGTITGGETWENEIVNERKNGERYYADQTITPLVDAHDTIRYFIAINNEITELKDRERELEEQNERLESFASLLSHDLRNPLNVAQGHLDLAEETGDPEDFERVRQAHSRMNTLIEDVLTLARQGQALAEPEQIRLDAVVHDAWDHVATADATLDSTLSPAATVVGDPSRVGELFENLFRNAVEHAGQAVTVTVGELDDDTGFYVVDDGPGIPEDARDDIFDAGFTTADDGTGLGLAIVQEIATAHAWQTSLDDEGDGTCFIFRIPPDRWQGEQ